jgi:NAD(P)-dependent dehydrogenase (short-subunit alcohol dehydrogenase family)
MAVAVVTGSAALIGSEAVRQLAGKGFTVVGIDNDMRRQLCGDEAASLPRVVAPLQPEGYSGRDLRAMGQRRRRVA